jgi:hypothetical protein
VVPLTPVGDAALFVLAIALSCAFGVAGVVLGAVVGVRTVTRDENRFEDVQKFLENVVRDQTAIRQEWAVTLENLDQLSSAVELKRRRTAASLSAAVRKEDQAPPECPPTVSEERDAARRRMRSVG